MAQILDQVSNRSGGPLQRAVSEAIVSAAREELAEQGFARFSVERVARRAEVGKAALYRRWPSKEAMLEWLLQGAGVAYAESPDTGSLRGDLEAYVSSAAGVLSEPTNARIAAHLYGELATDSAFAELIRETVEPLKDEPVRGLLHRAGVRGEIPDDLDLSLARDLLLGSLYWRLVMLRGALGQEDAIQLARMLEAALRASGREPCTQAPERT